LLVAIHTTTNVKLLLIATKSTKTTQKIVQTHGKKSVTRLNNTIMNKRDKENLAKLYVENLNDVTPYSDDSEKMERRDALVDIKSGRYDEEPTEQEINGKRYPRFNYDDVQKLAHYINQKYNSHSQYEALLDLFKKGVISADLTENFLEHSLAIATKNKGIGPAEYLTGERGQRDY
jgi:hypothetical protein